MGVPLFHPAIAATATLALFITDLDAQSVNTRNLNWYRRTAQSENHNDVWGMNTPDGSEYVIFGERLGFSIVENSISLRVVGFFAAPGGGAGSTHRAFTSVGSFFYSVSEHHGGIRVLEILANGTAKDHGLTQTTNITSAHGIQADPDTGYLYVLGGNNRGMVILDANRDPQNPPIVGTWNSHFVHDACIYRGRAYACTGTGFATRILDIRSPNNIAAIGTCSTPAGFNHSAWVSQDEKLLVIGDELPRNGVSPHMTIWDVSDPTAPVKRGDYDPGNGAIAHDPFVLGRGAYMSYYADGFHFVDITDPTNPSLVAAFNPSTATSGQRGVWGCYPFADSGTIYITDTERGLFAVQINSGHINRYGSGTAGARGIPRAEFEAAIPRVGASDLRLRLENLEPNRSFWVVVSPGRGPGIWILGARLEVGVPGSILLGPFVADANGAASLKTPVPNRTSLANARPHFQVFSLRPNGRLSASRGMWAGIGK